MENISNCLQSSLGIEPAAQHKLLISVLVVLALTLGHRIIYASLIGRIKDNSRRYQWQAIALKDPLTNIVAWVFILWRKPFEVGDRIEIGQYAGDVVDQRIFQFSMMEIGNWVDSNQSTGRILHIPKGMILTSGVANYTHGPDYIWNEILVLITFESDWEKAKGLLQEPADTHDVSLNENAAREFEAASRKFLLKYNIYTSVVDSGVLLTVRYLCKPRQRRGTTQAIWEEILSAFAKHPDIDLAYPTTRFYAFEQQEG